jgi:dynamin 1-like protein
MAIVHERQIAAKQSSILPSATDPKVARPNTQIPNPSATINQSLIDQNDENGIGFFGSFFQKKKKPGTLENPPPILKATGTLSEREYMETEVISTSTHHIFIH